MSVLFRRKAHGHKYADDKEQGHILGLDFQVCTTHEMHAIQCAV